MQNKKYLELDALAAPNGYVALPTKEDLAYVGVTPTRCVFIYSVVKTQKRNHPSGWFLFW